MKKSILLILLLVISLSSVSIFAFSTFAERNNVVFTENIIYGDRSTIEGLEINYKTKQNNQLFWETTLSFEDNLNVKSNHKFYPAKQYEDLDSNYIHSGLHMNVDIYKAISNLDYATGIEVAYKELFESLAPGEQGSKTVFLKDYLDYYDLQISFDFPSYNWNYNGFIFTGGNTGSLRDEENPRYFPSDKVVYDIGQYFKIPILDSETYDVELGKHENGQVAMIGGGHTEGERFTMETFSVLTGEACYFTFNPYGTEGSLVDLSYLRDGYGIFCLPHVISADDTIDANFIKTEELSMVYPLDPAAKIYALKLDDAQSKLFLYTIVDNQLVLKIIEIESMNLLQEITIMDSFDGTSLSIHQDKDYIVLFDYQNETVTLFAQNEHYEFENKFTCSFYPDSSMGKHPYPSALYYNGSQLACVSTRPDSEYLSAGFTNLAILVYGENGLSFAANYFNSLDSGVSKEPYYYSCESLYENPIKLSW